MLGYDDVLAPQPDVASEIDPDGQQRPVLTGDYRHHAGWHISTLTPGTLIREPAPLFRKLDDSLIAEELARLGTK
jgi:methionyl-tRNA synthetase